MHYVKCFDILGVNTVQVPCIELQGVPNTATEGAVGLFGMNMTSVDHEIYVCVGVSGNIYNWMPLKGEGGNTVTSANVNDAGELVLTLSNGTVINAGVVAGSGCFVNGVATDLNFDSDPQAQINDCVKKSGDTVDGVVNVMGALTLPNSPTTPEQSEPISHAYITRITANPETTGLTVVDGSITEISEIKGSTVRCENLIPFPYRDNEGNLYGAGKVITRYGVTFTFKADGSVTANGTCTHSDGIWLRITKLLPLKKGVSYRISGAPADGGVRKHLINVNCRNDAGEQVESYSDYENGRAFTISETSSVVGAYIYIALYYGVTYNDLVFKPMLIEGDMVLPYQPYFTDLKHSYFKGIVSKNSEETQEDTYELPQTLELAEYDSFNPQTGEITRGTHTIVFDGTENWIIAATNGTTNGASVGYRNRVLIYNAFNGVDENRICNLYENVSETKTYYNNKGVSISNTSSGTACYIHIYDPEYNTSDISLWKAHLAELYASGTPLIVEYELATPKTETVVAPTSYTAYNQGTETIIQGDTDNSIFGAMPTVTQIYDIHENPTEAANKAYVNNGLAKKLDKSGGTITGSLTVENGTNTTLSAFVARNNENTYGLAYDGDAYKLGKGTVDENGNFTFDESEGLPIALRDDSTKFTDGHIVKWSSAGNKFVDGGDLSKVATSGSYNDLADKPTTIDKATYATYASADTSKGTIEDRLSRLGFKSGALTNLPSGASGYIYKLGKFVYGCIQRGTDAAGTVSLSAGNTLFTIPDGFVPYTTIESIYGVQYTAGTGYSIGRVRVRFGGADNTDGKKGIAYIETNGQASVKTFTMLFGWAIENPESLG